jgi:hypothetical protein
MKTEQLEEVNSRMKELRAYLNSEKFHCGDELDNYVNISDVILRLNELDVALLNIESANYAALNRFPETIACAL